MVDYAEFLIVFLLFSFPALGEPFVLAFYLIFIVPFLYRSNASFSNSLIV